MHPELESLSKQLDTANAEAKELARQHSKEVLERRPASGGWSVAECWAHVAKTVESYLPALDSAITEARAAKVTGEGPYSYGLLGKFFLWALEPPSRVKVKAPAVFVPHQTDAERALQDFVAKHEALKQRIAAADGLDLGKVKLSSPANEKLRISLGVAFGSMTAHARRHLWQSDQVLEKV